ncbi:MAG: efflux RND transporter periplasmic adaptor subunit [Bacteroidales bacterium]
MKTKSIIPTILFLITVIVITSCNSAEENSPEDIRNRISEHRQEISELNQKINQLENQLTAMGGQVSSNNGIRVEVGEIQPVEFDHYFRINGSVEAVRDAIISPETNGQIRQIAVNRGDNVTAGQVVARLNTSVIENNIEEVKTNLRLAETRYERQKGLWEQQIGSEMQYLEARNAYEGLQSTLKSLESQLEMSVLRAPFTGIVDEIYLKEGEMAMPGVRIMQIIDLSQLYVNADVSETYLPQIDPDDTVILRFPSFPEYEENVQIHRLGNVINPDSRTFRLQLLIKNQNNRFKPNMGASLSIRTYALDNVIVVPTILIKQDIQGHFVFVARENEDGLFQARKAYIERGPEGEGRTVIEDGLSAGELLIEQGHNQVTDGASVIAGQI